MRAAQTDDRSLLSSPPDLRFDGKVVWVTGASRGLGRSLAFALAGAGAQVVASARSPEPLDQIAAEAETAGGAITALPASVTDPGSLADGVAAIKSRHGRLDALVNNAGISPYFAPAERLGIDALREVMETNTLGPYACSVAALPLLEERDGASIVNVSSIHGSRAHERLLAYATSKGALEMMTRTLAIEWADRGIRVNSLAPGYIETQMTEGLRESPRWNELLLGRIPLGRFASTAEIVACAMFLASADSSYVTGATLVADGGWSAR